MSKTPDVRLSDPMLQAMAALRQRRDAADRPIDMRLRRAGFEIAMEAAVRLAEPARRVSLGGVPCEILDTGTEGTSLLYLHGGGYCVGSPRTHRELAGRLARAARRPAVVPDYGLAPEHPFPAGLDDAFAVYCALAEQEGGAPALAGDSAGGGLALALMLRLREARLPLPPACGLMSPWTDLTLSGDAIGTRADRDPFLTPTSLESFAGAYAGGTDRALPLCSPLFGDLSGLPPLWVQVGSEEILFDDAARLVAGVRAAGGQAELVVGEGLFHVWQAVAPAPEAQAATGAMGRFLRAGP